MLNAVRLGATLLLLLGVCSAQPQNPSILVTPVGGYNPPNVLSLSVNTKKYAHAVSDRFLSITLEPATIFLALQKNLGSTTLNMARGLSPAYVRISGPECNYFRFQGGQTAPQQPPHPIKHGRNNVTVTGWHWSQLNEFVAKTGMDLIVGLNVMNRQQGTWDLSNAVDLISYSDKHGYKMAFQLGNDIQTIGSRVDGLSLGRDATRLRKVLEAFPRYANTEIIGPDVKSCETQEEARYLKNFITESGSSLSAITYQVPFSSEKNIENPTDMFNYVQSQLESRVWQKDVLNKYLGKIAVKKPLWIVESGDKDRKGDFSDGLTWAQRLCAAAKIGIYTILRKPSLLSLSEPTPDYWVSLLHKALIGPEVLDIKISSGNKTRLETVAHCTKMSPYDPNEGILAPEYRYNRGAVTIFGVNMGAENVKISLKTGEKQSLPLHQYMLTANNRQNGKRATRSSSTMLNGQKLILSPDGELPIISPKVRGSHQVITIPSQCAFFLVLPESKSKACTAVQIEESKETYKNGGKVIDQEEFDVTDYDTPVLDNEEEPVSIEKNTYVAFRPKNKVSTDEIIARRNGADRESKSTDNEMTQLDTNESHKNDKLELPESVIKYVTFSNNNWLSKFPKALKNQEFSEEFSTCSPAIEATTPEIPTERIVSPAQSRREKYHILAQAVTGRRHPEKNIRSDPNLNLESPATAVHYRPSQRLKLVKRSMDNDSNPKEIEETLKEFTNIEPRHDVDTFLKNEETSAVPLKLHEDHVEVHERSKIEDTPKNAMISEMSQSAAITSETTQTSITSTTDHTTSSSKALKQREKNTESHVQKIKSRAEQALAKANERNFQKLNGRRSHGKANKENSITAVQDPKPDGSTIDTSTETASVKNETNADEGVTIKIAEKLRRNRQTNSTTTADEDLKNIRSRVHLQKLKKSEKNADAEHVKVGSSAAVTDTTGFESGNTSASKTASYKLKNFEPKSLAKPRVVDAPESKIGKSLAKDSREITQHPAAATAQRVLPVSHRLARVRTPPAAVDGDQMDANRKITDRIFENIRNGEKKLQSEPVVSPITAGADSKNAEEDRTESGRSAAGLMAGARIKALEEKIKARRSEMERRLHEKFHKVNRRSATSDNSLVVGDDVMDIKDVPDRFGSNELDVDVGSVVTRETIRRRLRRSMADFTVKLNEVNTYVDKVKKARTDPRNNEIAEEEGAGFSVGPEDDSWMNTNDIRLSAEDDGIANFKPKRKSVFKSLQDEDDYGQAATTMINKLLSHMQKFWKYIKRTILF